MAKRNEGRGDIGKDLNADERETRKQADRYNVPFIELAGYPVDRDLVQSIPVDFLYRLNFVPLGERDGLVQIAIADPSDLSAIDAIESFLGRKVQVLAASRRAISREGRHSFQSRSSTFSGFTAMFSSST